MRALAALLFLALFGAFTSTARADERAPGVEASEIHTAAQRELDRQLTELPPPERTRLLGTYVAIDANPSDPFAQVACDDDGDHVVVFSEAMLRLIGHVARAVALDEANGSHKTRDYAALLARTGVGSRRLLPPAPGFYDGDATTAPLAERLDEMFAFVLAREVARLRAGDLECPKPTATKESGDDHWTPSEQRNAAEVRSRVYAGKTDRDEAAWRTLLAGGRGEKGGLGFLRFFGELEGALRARGSAGWPTYLALHPDAAARADALGKLVPTRISGNGDKTRAH